MSTQKPWPDAAAPTPPPGFTVTRFAEGLAHPRWLYELPNGDVLVALAHTHPQGEKGGVTGRLKDWLVKDSGMIGTSANQIILLRDSNGDGIVDVKTVFLGGLNQPFGMVLVGDNFYVANTDGIWRYPYQADETAISGDGERILTLPAGGYNNHWTRNIVVNADGSKFYVSVGSSSNIGENGLEEEVDRAAVLEVNLDGSGKRLFASGLRNPTGMDWEPTTGVLWTAVNERDLLGDDLVPDYMTRVRDGDFYGWPYSYWGKHVDDRVQPQRADLVAQAIAPDYALGSHSAALGLAFYTGSAFPKHYRGGAIVALHGSWNRSYFSGYRVVYIPFENGMPKGLPEDFLTGFMPDPATGIAYGRPVGVMVDRNGAVLIADDTGGIIWRVTKRGN